MKHLLAMLLLVGLVFSFDIVPIGGGIGAMQPGIFNLSTYPLTELASGQVREGTTQDVVGIGYFEGMLVLATNSRIDNSNLNRFYALDVNGRRIEEMDSFTVPVQEESHASALSLLDTTWYLLSYANSGANRTCTLNTFERNGGAFIPSGSQVIRAGNNDFWCEDFAKSNSGFFFAGRGFELDLHGYEPLASDARMHDSTPANSGQFRSVAPLDLQGTRFVAAGELRDGASYKGLLQVYHSDAQGILPVAQSLLLNRNRETGFTGVTTLKDKKTIFVTGAFDTDVRGYDQGILRKYVLVNDRLSFEKEADFDTFSSNITVPSAIATGDVDGDGTDEVVVLANTFDFGAYDAQTREYAISKQALQLLVFDQNFSLKGSKSISLARNERGSDLQLLLSNVNNDERPEIIAAWNNGSAQIRIFKAPFVDVVAPSIEVVEPPSSVAVGLVPVVVRVSDNGVVSKVWVEVGSLNRTLAKENGVYSASFDFNNARSQLLKIFAKDSSGNLARFEYTVDVVAPEVPPVVPPVIEPPVVQPPVIQPPVVEPPVMNNVSQPANNSQENNASSALQAQELDNAVRELEIKIDILKSQNKPFEQAQESLLSVYKSKSEGNLELALSQAHEGIRNADALLAASQVVESPTQQNKGDQTVLYVAGILMIVVVLILGYFFTRKK